jgi:hypothetical protein
MRTDVPLKTLTRLCATDMLALLGVADAEVLGVDTLELPTTATAVDTVLYLRTPAHGPYLHLLEWQGYRDTRFLWRVLAYLGWLGQNREERPVAASLVYLQQSDDVGDTLTQEVPGQGAWTVRFHCVRLWEHDAAAAVHSGRPGLAVLSPLMAGATEALVEDAARVVLHSTVRDRRQADLLTILGILAEPVMDARQFVRLMGKEQLMASDLISYLTDELVAERTAALQHQLEEERTVLQHQLEEERTALQRQLEERAALQRQLQQVLVEAIEDTVAARFPQTPAAIVLALRDVQDPKQLRQALRAVQHAADQATVEAALLAAQPHG